MKGYKGAHSMISKKSYVDAVKKFGYDISNFVWVNDDPKERTHHEWIDKCKGGHWNIRWERVLPEGIFRFLSGVSDTLLRQDNIPRKLRLQLVGVVPKQREGVQPGVEG